MLRFHCPYYEVAYALMDYHPVFAYAIPTFGLPSMICSSHMEKAFQCRWNYEDVKPDGYPSERWRRTFVLNADTVTRKALGYMVEGTTRFQDPNHRFNGRHDSIFELFDLWDRYTDYAVDTYIKPAAFHRFRLDAVEFESMLGACFSYDTQCHLSLL